jgi:hypothetical protein
LVWTKEVFQTSDIQGAWLQQKFKFYLTIELIDEMICTHNSKARHLLPEFANLLLLFMNDEPGRVLNNYRFIVLGELGLRDSGGVCLDVPTSKKILNMLKDFKQKRYVENVPDFIKEIYESKHRTYNYFKQNKIETTERMKGAIKSKDERKVKFQDYLKHPIVESLRRQSLLEIIQREKIQVSESKIKEVLSHPEQYPFYHTYFDLTMSQNFRYNVLERTVKEGDDYDQSHLMYLRIVDKMISADTGMAELSTLSYGDSSKVMNINQFLTYIRT